MPILRFPSTTLGLTVPKRSSRLTDTVLPMPFRRASAKVDPHVAGLLLLVFVLGIFDMQCGDIWWHLRTGQLIWRGGEVPRTDWFSYANPDAPWIDLHWGFQLAVAGLWALGGTPALILAKAIVGAMTIAVCLTVGQRRWPQWHGVACWLAPALLFSTRYLVRPEVVSLFLLAATLAVIYHGRRGRGLVWMLPLIQLLWVNVQVLFVLQYIVLACFWVDRLIRRWWRWGMARGERDQPLAWRTWLVATAATALVSLANPYGIRGAILPWTLAGRIMGAGREFFHQFSDESRGMDVILRDVGLGALVGNAPALLFLLVFFGGAASFILLAGRRRLDLYRLFVFAAFAYLTYRMVRNSVPFALVAGMVIRLNVGELVDEAAFSGGQGGSVPVAAKRPRVAFLLGGFLALLILLLPSGLIPKTDRWGWPRKLGLGQTGWYGHEAAEFLAQAGMPDYIYAMHEGQAAVCIYHLAPEKRVFADGRLEVHTIETLARYRQILEQLTRGDPRAEENLTRDIPPGPDGRREMPALVFDNRTLLDYSLQQPGLLHSLLAGGRWRCVFCDTKETELAEDPTRLLDGATVFLDLERAVQLGLPAADVRRLLWLTDLGPATLREGPVR